MQDDAPCHSSKLVSDFLKNKNFKTFDCFGKTPDLNLIKNLWAILKDKWQDEHSKSAKNLKMARKRIWTQKTTAEYCKHQVHSILCRLQAVIKNSGGHTKY